MHCLVASKRVSGRPYSQRRGGHGQQVGAQRGQPLLLLLTLVVVMNGGHPASSLGGGRLHVAHRCRACTIRHLRGGIVGIVKVIHCLTKIACLA
eukprot:COSAG02_NODE_180_length_31057_cov_21.869501_10_plen_94_part_00